MHGSKRQPPTRSAYSSIGLAVEPILGQVRSLRVHSAFVPHTDESPAIIRPAASTSQATSEASPLDRTDRAVSVIAVGPVLSPTAHGESEVTFWRVTVFEVDDV